MKLSFAYAGRQKYDQEFMILIQSNNKQDDSKTDHIKLFGVIIEEKKHENAIKTAYMKDLKNPFQSKNNHICGFFKIGHNQSLIAFDDGVVWTLDNEDNNGIVLKYKLKLPFKKATSVLFNFEEQILMLRNELLEKAFFKFEKN